MGQKYTTQSASGYNNAPPPDDGTTVAANKITWASIKSKLADVLNTFIAAVNTQLVTALDYSATTTSVNYTTVPGDHQKPIECTGTITISLGDATTMAAGYQVPVFNKGTGLVTVTPITGTDTLNGTAGASVVLPPFTGMLFCVNQAANGYNIQDASSPYRQGADVASAATVNLRTTTGDYVNITGTTTITAITLDKGQERTVQFSGILTLTNGASLILPGGVNITTAAGDTAKFRGEAAGVVRCVAYEPATVTGTGATVKAASPALTGTPTAPTAAVSDNSTKIATTAYADRAGTALVLIQAQTVTAAATADFTTGITSTYDEFLVHYSGVIGSVDLVDMGVRVSQDGGATYKADATYHYCGRLSSDVGADAANQSAAATYLRISSGQVSINSGRPQAARIMFTNPSDGAFKEFQFQTSNFNGSNQSDTSGSGFYAGSGTAINAIRFILSSGNVTGNFKLYGVKKS